MKRKLFIMLVLVLSLVTAFGGMAQPVYANSWFNSDGSIYISANGIHVETDVNPYIKNDRIFVPLRAIVDALMGEISWDNATKEVTIKKGPQTIVMKVGSRDFFVNGAKVTNDVAPENYQGRVMVPLRFISEQLDAHVWWSPESRFVEITLNQEILEPPVDVEEKIMELAKDDSSWTNIYNDNPEDTKLLYAALKAAKERPWKLIDIAWDNGTVPGTESARSGFVTNYEKHELTIIQSNRYGLSYDVTWVILDELFSYEDASKVWYSIDDYLKDLTNGDQELGSYSGTVTGYKYIVEGLMPTGFKITFDKI